MKIKEIRKLDVKEIKPLSVGCGSAPENGADKPPC